MKMFAGGEVGTMLLVFVFLVWLADRVSSWLRGRWHEFIHQRSFF